MEYLLNKNPIFILNQYNYLKIYMMDDSHHINSTRKDLLKFSNQYLFDTSSIQYQLVKNNTT